MMVGYSRVSTEHQNIGMPRRALIADGSERIGVFAFQFRNFTRQSATEPLPNIASTLAVSANPR